MKPREQAGVVDSSLSVYGIQNLKVAGTSHWLGYDCQLTNLLDMSIAPSNVGANTYNTASATPSIPYLARLLTSRYRLVIGEKAAVIIASELGIKGVN